MIRFVDIRGQGLGYRFSFFNTVTDRYVEFSGEQAWDTWEEFAGDATVATDRFRRLCPAWVFEAGEDDVAGWYLKLTDAATNF